MRTARDEVLAAKEEILRGSPEKEPHADDTTADTAAAAVLAGLFNGLRALVAGRRFAPRCRRSRKLDLLCETLETGGERFLVDFLEELDELADAAEASSVGAAAGWPAAAGRSWTAGSGRSRWPGT